jgi:hypothetical protein
MRINRGLLNWGVFLIALGGIPLAVDQGWLESDIASDLGQLWPLILVGIGLGLILRWTPLSWFGGALVAATFGVILGAAAVSLRDNELGNIQGIIPAVASTACAGDEVGEATTSEGGIATADDFSAEVTLSCGELQLDRATGATWSLEAQHDAEDPPQIEQTEREGMTAGIEIGQDPDYGMVFLGGRSQSRWDLDVPAEAALRIGTTLNAASATIVPGSGPITRVDGTWNASEATIDLADATWEAAASLGLTLNASDGRLALPAGNVLADITLNASSLEICVPESAALEIDYTSVLGSDDLDSSGLDEVGSGRWATPAAADADGRVVLSITNTVSSLSIERPEACS